jgi:hypothetical protein
MAPVAGNQAIPNPIRQTLTTWAQCRTKATVALPKSQTEPQPERGVVEGCSAPGPLVRGFCLSARLCRASDDAGGRILDDAAEPLASDRGRDLIGPDAQPAGRPAIPLIDQTMVNDFRPTSYPSRQPWC